MLHPSDKKKSNRTGSSLTFGFYKGGDDAYDTEAKKHFGRQFIAPDRELLARAKRERDGK